MSSRSWPRRGLGKKGARGGARDSGPMNRDSLRGDTNAQTIMVQTVTTRSKAENSPPKAKLGWKKSAEKKTGRENFQKKGGEIAEKAGPP